MNVLHIVLDDAGREEMQVYGIGGQTLVGVDLRGRPYAVTPRLNALAASGLVFANFYSTPFCATSRAEYFTMRVPDRSGQGQLIGARPGQPNSGTEFSFMESERTFVEILRENGVRTGHFGKWHLSTEFNGGSMGPLRQGFEFSSGTYQNLFENEGETYYAYEWIVNGQVRRVTNRYLTSHTIDHAARWIARNGTRPWYAYVALHAPHGPFWKPPASLYTTDFGMTTDQAPTGDVDMLWKYERAMFEAADTEIGRLLDTMDPAVLANTVILIGSDNGIPSNFWKEFPVSGTDAEHHPIFGWYDRSHYKFTTLEGGVHVPFIVAGAGVVSPGRTVTGLAQGADIGPTVLEAMGLADKVEPAGVDQVLEEDERYIDGRSFWKSITVNTASTNRPFVYTSRFSPDGPNPGTSGGDRMIRDSQYQLRIWRDYIDGPARIEEFYDLLSDPLQQFPIANPTGIPATRRAALLAEMKRILSTCNNPYP